MARHGVPGRRQQPQRGHGPRAAGSPGRGTPRAVTGSWRSSTRAASVSSPRDTISATQRGRRSNDYRDKTLRWRGEQHRERRRSGGLHPLGPQGAPAPTRHLLILSGHGSGTTEDFLLSDETSKDSLTIDELSEALGKASEQYSQQEDRHSRDGRLLHEHGRDRLRDPGPRRHPDRGGGAGARVRVAVPPNPGQGESLPRRTSPADNAGNRVPATHGPKRAGNGDRPGVRRALLRLRSECGALRRSGGGGPRADRGRSRTLSRTWSTALPTPGTRRAIRSCSWPIGTPRRTRTINSSDLTDLCDQIKRQFRAEAEISDACTRCHRRDSSWDLSACVIKSGCSGFACQYSYGLSIYFPWAIVAPEYGNLTFASSRKRHRLARVSRDAHQTPPDVTRRDTRSSVLPARVGLAAEATATSC